MLEKRFGSQLKLFFYPTSIHIKSTSSIVDLLNDYSHTHTPTYTLFFQYSQNIREHFHQSFHSSSSSLHISLIYIWHSVHSLNYQQTSETVYLYNLNPRPLLLSISFSLLYNRTGMSCTSCSSINLQTLSINQGPDGACNFSSTCYLTMILGNICNWFIKNIP